MSFFIQFRESKGDYDFAAPFINLVGNGAVLVAGAGGIATVSHVALKTLGYDQAAESVVLAVPIAIAEMGFAGTLIGGTVIAAMVAGVSRGYSK